MGLKFLMPDLSDIGANLRSPPMKTQMCTMIHANLTSQIPALVRTNRIAFEADGLGIWVLHSTPPSLFSSRSRICTGAKVTRTWKINEDKLHT